MAATEQGQELHLTMANEDYLECMVRIEQEEGAEGGVRSVDIATRLEVSKASVNKAVSVLKAQGLVEQVSEDTMNRWLTYLEGQNIMVGEE